MAFFQRKTPLEKEWNCLCKQEEKFLKSRAAQKQSVLDRMLREKVPEKMQNALDTAFLKAFILIFEKGTDLLEKTYSREKLEQIHAVDRYANSLSQSRKNLRAYGKKAGKTSGKNVLVSGLSGIGLGFFGVGLPDIPLFTAMLLRNLYEIALRYGYGYESEAEQYFILLLIQGGVSYGETLEQINEQVDRFLTRQEVGQREEALDKTAALLSRELLYMKFLQGIPFVGMVGGVSDLFCMKRISAYARLKYQKRFLYGEITG